MGLKSESWSGLGKSKTTAVLPCPRARHLPLVPLVEVVAQPNQEIILSSGPHSGGAQTAPGP